MFIQMAIHLDQPFDQKAVGQLFNFEFFSKHQDFLICRFECEIFVVKRVEVKKLKKKIDQK